MKVKLLFLGLMLAGVFGVSAQTKVGYTNVELLMSKMPEVQQAEKTLSTYERELSRSLEVQQQTYNAKIQEYYRLKESGITQEEDQRRVKEIQNLEKQIQTDVAKADEKLMNKRGELLEPITKQIQAKIDEVAQEGGFTYILNQNSGTNILYGLETLDVTNLIAAKLGINID